MIERPTLRTLSPTVADPANQLIVEPRGPLLMDDLQLLERQAHRVRKPRITVLSGSAGYGAPTTTIDVTDYCEIKAFAQTAKRTDRSLSSAAGALVAVAAGAVVAITLSLTPASDGPAPVAGPLSGHSILHFPR
jgi:catalase